MTRILSLLFLFTLYLSGAQPNTDVFLFDLNTENGAFNLSNMKNISNNEGYDNQPSFLDNNTVLYAGTRNGQTDIVRYTINYDSKVWLNYTEGSEYSPLKIPGQNYVSSIRLEKDGTQKLYKYSLRNGESEVLKDDIVIGYHVWADENTLVSSVLEENGLSLYATHFSENKNYRLQKKIGRSLHKIPDSELVSYISKENDSLWEIKSVDPNSGATEAIMATLPKAEDMCWLANGSILMGHESTLYTFRPNYDVDWNEVASLESYEIKNITRLAISPDGTKLVLVGEGGKQETKEEKPSSNQNSTNSATAEAIVQKQLDAYNNKDLDAFMATYSEDIKLYDYPNKIINDTKEKMRESYKGWFENTRGLNAKVTKRILIGNKVIDHEEVTANGQTFKAVAIYEVKNGLINRVTFIRE